MSSSSLDVIQPPEVISSIASQVVVESKKSNVVMEDLSNAFKMLDYEKVVSIFLEACDDEQGSLEMRLVHLICSEVLHDPQDPADVLTMMEKMLGILHSFLKEGMHWQEDACTKYKYKKNL